MSDTPVTSALRLRLRVNSEARREQLRPLLPMPAGVLAGRGALQTIGRRVRRYTPTSRRLAARAPGWSSGTRISLLWVAAQDRVLAELTDPDGRSVVLLARIWENKITRDHPELRDHLDQVVGTVAEPDHAEPDPRAERRRYYRRRVGPSRWLLVVVSFEQRPGRIITAVATRKDPRQWKP